MIIIVENLFRNKYIYFYRKVLIYQGIILKKLCTFAVLTLFLKQMLFNMMGKAYEPDNSPFHTEHIDAISELNELKRELNDHETRECLVSSYSFLVLVVYLIDINFC